MVIYNKLAVLLSLWTLNECYLMVCIYVHYINYKKIHIYSVLYKNVQFPTDPQALYREQYFSDKKNADIKVLLKVTK